MRNQFVSSAVALFLTTLAAPAVAQSVSDSLKVGTNPIKFLTEGSEPNLVSSLDIADSQGITGTETILLTEPGTSDISDIVTASIDRLATTGIFVLSVTLISDTETPLTFGSTPFESIPETGAVQDLTSDFTTAFDLNTGALPTIQVRSDQDAVPEPSTWALMTLGFGVLGGAGWRSRRRSVSIA
jgi:hypothetical protein